MRSPVAGPPNHDYDEESTTFEFRFLELPDATLPMAAERRDFPAK